VPKRGRRPKWPRQFWRAKWA